MASNNYIYYKRTLSKREKMYRHKYNNKFMAGNNLSPNIINATAV